MKKILLLLLVLCANVCVLSAREEISLNDGWRSVCYPEGKRDSMVCENVQLPHNWDDYYGYRNLSHGNLHGTARYDRVFHLGVNRDQEAFLRLEGVGSYVSVYLNGKEVCKHKPAGRVTTTIDITQFLQSDNRLSIICEHPSGIEDLPWVCGGCNPPMAMIEGSAPFGLFRNVSIEVTDQLRVEPFGVHVWANDALDTLYVETEVRNYANHAVDCLIQTVIEGRARRQSFSMGARLTQIIKQQIPLSGLGIKPWSPEYPQLYDVTSLLMRGEQHMLADKIVTTTGFTSLRWPMKAKTGDDRFYLNDKPVFLNGIGEFEHNFGQSHAFIYDEIDRRASLVKKLGFNTFSDVCLPHNLRYQENWDKQGTMQVCCFSGNVWHDTPAFRNNFKTLLRQWVKEHRNSPSLILWDLQANSLLPKDFERECIQIIHELDGRKDRPVSAEQSADAPLFRIGYQATRLAGDVDSEMAFCDELHKQMCEAWQDRNNRCGQFLGAMFSAERPGAGRREHKRNIDNAGPFSGDGLFNAFWEPTEAYYLYVAWGAFLNNGANSNNDPTKYTARQMVEIGYRLDGIPMPDYLLPESEKAAQRKRFGSVTPILEADAQRAYLYRYNCGGDELVDSYGHTWMGDDTRYSYSWAQAPAFASDPISPVLASQFEVPGWAIAVQAANNKALQYAAQCDQPLLRTHRWGRQNLHFYFPLPEKEIYLVDIYFVNTRHVVHHVSYKARVGADGVLDIAFPNVKIGQAKVAAIAISLPRVDIKPYGKVDRAGNFTFNAETEAKLKAKVPALRKAKGYPYSEGLRWEDITK